MKLPVIKQLINFAAEKDADYLQETIETLESVTEVETLKDEELDVIGELLSNLYGAMEVQSEIEKGATQKDALNGFMKRVLGSIDK
ncbi:DUF6952 family protein [Portibacter lacus]|uniref:Uncharacterized protein n=1 Tax=Portibacter lacus TaxID=1099794 RepID=A0AA37SMT6_9BACT|nr:hypothetical protein [Portibacter lacus]GLR16249.1 hypothetical protein GCM10007940_08640 [Portibacter lacus]